MNKIEKIFYDDVKIQWIKEDVLTIKGNLGQVTKKFGGNDLYVDTQRSLFLSKCSYRTFLALINNALKGVSIGYFCELNFVGLGYRFLHINNYLLLKVGYAHYIKVYCPMSLHIFGYKKRLIIFGVDLVELNNFIAVLRNYREPDIYKGKGIRISGENLIFKVGKQKL